jgi:predicted O-methyltransferase YrrM
MYKNPSVESSYRQNNLGKTLYDLVLKFKPKKIIDFGVLHGYSTISMAQALRDLGKGKIVGYDLFEDYPYNHAVMTNTQQTIDKLMLGNIITLKKKELYAWLKQPEKFNLMHLDVSNNGQIVSDVFDSIKDQIKSGSILIFEGGTKERDKVNWMKKFNKPAIYPLKKTLNYQIIDSRFPGLSIIKK